VQPAAVAGVQLLARDALLRVLRVEVKGQVEELGTELVP
jgi:hypothetical protein